MREVLTTMSKYFADTLVVSTKLKLAASVVTSTLFFFFGHLYTDGLIAILMLIIIDTILGVTAAYIEGQEISSRRFGGVVQKGFVYFSSISAGYFADQTVPFNIIQGTMISFMGIQEFISILENTGRLGYQTPKKLLNQMKEYRDNK